MTDQKKLKRAIRARSEKTGESYTSARRQVLQARAKKTPIAQEATPEKAEAPAPPPPAAAKKAAAPAKPVKAAKPAKKVPAAPSPRGQVNDASARKQTGHGLDHWFAVLDAFGGRTKGHTAAARHLYEEHGVPGWYAQGITVAYERTHGLREMNQACTGGFQVSVTKTLPAPLEAVVSALADPKRRAAWLAGADPALAEALEAAFTGPKPKEVKVKGSESARLRYRWGASTVELRLTAKATGTSVAADNMNLQDSGQVEERRTVWKSALEALLGHLSGPPGAPAARRKS